ncbi:MAG: hypothetical protein EOO01_33155 [Chitinophagaceae bacterium]|nr:MAG: hypothetical protein EOO01_33155 [Chitinophagaceae bacterium]
MPLTLFQNITEELTQLEKETLVPMLVDTLSFTHSKNRHIGKHICAWFNASGHKVSEVRLRKMINYIRVLNVQQGVEFNLGGKVVIGAGNGYFVTDEIEIVKDQIDSLQGRVDSMKAVIDSLKAQLENLKYRSKCKEQ